MQVYMDNESNCVCVGKLVEVLLIFMNQYKIEKLHKLVDDLKNKLVEMIDTVVK